MKSENLGASASYRAFTPKDGSNPSGGEIEKLDGMAAGRIRPRNKIDPFLYHGKGLIVNRFEHLGLLPTISGNFPKDAGPGAFDIINPFGVSGFQGREATFPGHLLRSASRRLAFSKPATRHCDRRRNKSTSHRATKWVHHRLRHYW